MFRLGKPATPYLPEYTVSADGSDLLFKSGPHKGVTLSLVLEHIPTYPECLDRSKCPSDFLDVLDHLQDSDSAVCL